jgi:hypothetical protein
VLGSITNICNSGNNRLCSRALKQWLVCCNIEWRSALVPELAAFICTIVGSEIAVRVQCAVKGDSSFFGPIRNDEKS